MKIDETNVFSIGEVCLKLGVTTSFLKYYEQQGILDPIVMPNGYRFYEGRHLSIIQECIKYKSLGKSAKEISQILNSPMETSLPIFTEKCNDIDQQIIYLQFSKQFLECCVNEYPKYMSHHNWTIDEHGDFYFLCQADIMQCKNDKRIQQLSVQWNEWLPVIRIASILDRRDPADKRPTWGMAMPGKFARAMDLSYGEPVQYIPPSRSLVVYDRRPISPALPQTDSSNQASSGPVKLSVRNRMLKKTNYILDTLHLTPLGPSYFFVRAKVFEDGTRYTYQKIITPIV